MLTAVCKLKSVSPYSQSRYLQVPTLPNETKDEHDKRVWRERAHWNEDGKLFIPPSCFKNSLSEAAKYNPIQIKGRGKATYTKNFKSGVMVTDALVLDITRETVLCETLFVPSDAKTGGTTRVPRTFPLIPSWSGTIRYLILDETLTKEVFEQVLKVSGSFIGIGRYRPASNGYYGRFSVESIKWE